MKKQDFTLNITSVEKTKRPFRASFGRINIILGTNGSGKSSILRTIITNHASFDNMSEVIYIEGGRSFIIPSTLAMTAQTIAYATPDRASALHASKKMNKLSDRITDGLFALDRQGETEYRNHSDLVDAWIKNDQEGDVPKRNTPPLEKLFELFTSIFPDIELAFDNGSKQITCKKNGSLPYKPSDLSDGEKQVFCLIIDLLLLSKENSLILVDEPELNLHPSLALDFWSLIESNLPDSVFIYATHSVAFALKQDVDSLLVIPRTGLDPISVKNLDEINSDELRLFLGAIPAILTTPKAVIVEGEKSSIDTIIYRWLIGNKSIAVEAVGSCNNVLSALKRDGVWKSIGESQKLIGIIDRDFRTEPNLKIIQTDGVIVLPFHEIESIFSIPKLVCLLTERLGLMDTPSEDQVVQKLINVWEEEYLYVAIKRTFDSLALSLRISPSLTRKELSVLPRDDSVIRDKVVACCLSAIDSICIELTSTNISEIFNFNMNECKNILINRDVNGILKFMPAKLMASNILQFTGCKSLANLACATTKHIKIEDIPELHDFSKKMGLAF